MTTDHNLGLPEEARAPAGLTPARTAIVTHTGHLPTRLATAAAGPTADHTCGRSMPTTTIDTPAEQPPSPAAIRPRPDGCPHRAAISGGRSRSARPGPAVLS